MNRFVITALVVTLVAFCQQVTAQRSGGGLGKFTKSKRYISVGLTANAINYFGDIVPKNRAGSFDTDFTRPNVGFFVQKRLWPRITIRMGGAWGVLSGEDHTTSDPDDFEHGGAFRYKRNLHFRNRIYDLTTVAVVDIIQNRGLAERRPDSPIPYLLAGVGAFYHNPQALRPEGFEGSEWVDLRPLRTENQERPYSEIEISFPVGLGVRYRLSESWDIAFEISYRFTLTDYLDDVSGDYIDLGEFDSDLARALHDRSAEPVALLSGEVRSPETISYNSAVDGRPYEVVNGYGMPNNRRGAPDNDIFIVTGFQISYIFNKRGFYKFR